MINSLKSKTYNFLRYTQKYTGTDNVYLARGGFWITLGKIISLASVVLLSIAFANLLPRETFGTYKYVLSILAILSIPSLGSMGVALTQAVSRGYEGSFVPIIKKRIKWGMLGTLASLITATYYYLNNDTTLAISFLIISFFIPIIDSLVTYTSFLNGKKEFKVSSQFTIIKQISYLAIMAATLFLTKNIFIILLVYFIPKVLLNYIFLKTTLHKFKPNKKKDPKTIPYGVYLSLLGITIRIASNIDKLLLWHFFGATQLAVYAFAILPVQQIFGMVSKNISVLAFPKISVADEGAIKKALPKKIFKLFLLTIPMVLVYIVIAPPIFRMIYPGYSESIAYSQVFALSMLFIAPSILGDVFIAKMKKREIAIIRFTSPTIRIFLFLILTPIYGIWGIILATLIGQSFYVLLVIILFMKMKIGAPNNSTA